MTLYIAVDDTERPWGRAVAAETKLEVLEAVRARHGGEIREDGSDDPTLVVTRDGLERWVGVERVRG